MDPLSLTAAISTLLVGSARIVQLSNDVRQKSKNATMTMVSIASEVSTVNVALVQLQFAVSGQDLPSWKAEDRGKEAILQSFEAVTTSCTMTISVLEGYLLGIMEPDGEISTDSVNKKEKVRFIWNETEVGVLLQQLRGHQTSLGLLLNVLHSHSDIEIKRLLTEQNKISRQILEAVKTSGSVRLSVLSGITLPFDHDAIEGNLKLLSSPPAMIEEVEEQEQSSELVIQQNNSANALSKKKRRIRPSISVAINYFSNITITKKPTVLDYGELRKQFVPHPEPMSHINSSIIVGREQTLKCVVVGDASAEKSTLIITAVTDSYFGEYIPTVFDNYSYHVVRNGRKVVLGLWDMAGQEDYDRLRPLSYPQTDVFMFVFSIISPLTFASLQRKWIPEVEKHAPKTPCVLVGVKSSLRRDEATLEALQARGLRPVTEFQALELANAIDAHCYVECDTLTGENIKVPFNQACDAVLSPRTRT